MNRQLLMAAWILAVLATPSLAAADGWSEVGHIHDVAVSDNGAVYVAGHEGVYRLEGGAPVQLNRGHASSLAVTEDRLYLAGVDATGDPASLRVLRLTREAEASPVAGPEATTQAVLSVEGGGLYAVANQVLFFSPDRGRSWARRGALPDKVIDMDPAADEDVLYAATVSGLSVSRDGGRSWESVNKTATPVTTIALTDNHAYVFQYKRGLFRGTAGNLGSSPISNAFGPQVPVRMALDGSGRIYAVTNQGRLFLSPDGGKTWRRADRLRQEGSLSAAARKGRAIYRENCASCHGTDGVGEAPQLGVRAEGLAPALDETMHAWHHTDDNLRLTIREGTGRRMPGWGQDLTEREIGAVIAYMKSLWDERALRCQGPAHMSPGCQTQR